MLQPVKKLAGVLLLLGGLNQANAFSLLGPYEPWQVVEIGYNLGGDIGGPVNLGEEYRWTSPTIVYGFDSQFLDYFGDEGVKAVRSAIAILDALPAFSEMSENLTEFPLDTRKINYQASALGLSDLKSYALSTLLEELGLASPDRYAWTLRSRVNIVDEIFQYVTIIRNFDPVSLRPSPYVNGTLYTYQILQTFANPDTWESVEVSVDPLAPSVTAVASLVDGSSGTMEFRGAAILSSPGLFFTGLTRDDVGGLRYLYRRGNQNVETLPTNIVTSFGAVSGGSGSPWQPVPNPGTVNTNTPGTGGITNNLVNVALRPGVDKLTFREATFDSVLGQFFTNTVSYNDQYITNGTLRRQTVTRGLTVPDIVFSAGDLDVAGGIPVLGVRTATTSWQNNNTLQSAGVNSPVPPAGPGQIGTGGGIQITFSKIGPFFVNITEEREQTAIYGFVWGSFDGTTNAPVVFPRGTTIEQLEGAVRAQAGGGAGNSPWRLPP